MGCVMIRYTFHSTGLTRDTFFRELRRDRMHSVWTLDSCYRARLARLLMRKRKWVEVYIDLYAYAHRLTVILPTLHRPTQPVCAHQFNTLLFMLAQRAQHVNSSDVTTILSWLVSATMRSTNRYRYLYTITASAPASVMESVTFSLLWEVARLKEFLMPKT